MGQASLPGQGPCLLPAPGLVSSPLDHSHPRLQLWGLWSEGWLQGRQLSANDALREWLLEDPGMFTT